MQGLYFEEYGDEYEKNKIITILRKKVVSTKLDKSCDVQSGVD